LRTSRAGGRIGGWKQRNLDPCVVADWHLVADDETSEGCSANVAHCNALAERCSACFGCED
jgi:hypothetical protein